MLKTSSCMISAEHPPDNPEANQDNNCDHDLQVRGPCTLLLLCIASQIRDITTTRGSCPAAFFIYGRTGFTVPQPDIYAGVVGRQPAVGAVFPSAVLAGERVDNFISAVIAPGHYSFLLAALALRILLWADRENNPGTSILILKEGGVPH
jgi:hypothetical protein